MEKEMVYISALEDSLQKKSEVMKELLELTREQGEILAQQDMEQKRFEEILNQKDAMLVELDKLDRGFEQIFQKVREPLADKKKQYRSQILQMQDLIRSITDCGVQIEAQEKKNQTAFQKYLVKERQEIKMSKASNRTALSYYQNMPDQHHSWQTYFMDQKQ